jgi:hypothetical protein
MITGHDGSGLIQLHVVSPLQQVVVQEANALTFPPVEVSIVALVEHDESSCMQTHDVSSAQHAVVHVDPVRVTG